MSIWCSWCLSAVHSDEGISMRADTKISERLSKEALDQFEQINDVNNGGISYEKQQMSSLLSNNNDRGEAACGHCKIMIRYLQYEIWAVTPEPITNWEHRLNQTLQITARNPSARSLCWAVVYLSSPFCLNSLWTSHEMSSPLPHQISIANIIVTLLSLRCNPGSPLCLLPCSTDHQWARVRLMRPK